MNEPLFDEKTLHANTKQNAGLPIRRSGRKSKPLDFGELIVDGLLQGIAAGIVMLVLFLVMGLLDGHPSAQILSALGLTRDATPVQGVLVHTAISAFYGVLWTLLLVLPVRLYLPDTIATSWEIVGVCFGCLTWIIAEAGILTITGPSMLPWWELLIAHLLYGGTLGLVQARQSAQASR